VIIVAILLFSKLANNLELVVRFRLFFIECTITPRRQPQCGVYLLFLFLTFTVYRFGECQPPENARIARLTARWQQLIIH
jgi:hypothetical protein